MSWFPQRLADHGDRVALVTETASITYRELAARVGQAASDLGPRRLVLLAAANHPDALTLYLAALAGGHPVLLVGADNRVALRSLLDAYDPDVVAAPIGGGGSWTVDERRPATRHRLHPDLALLLSTSGSTGSPKLVRLSRTNLASNADAIGASLRLEATDRAITSLPMAYCYGLSVINSHLARGASVVLTDRSIVTDDFWKLFRRTHATSLAGVPYTFDLLDQVGFDRMALPHLRAVTQAGGRLAPERVRRYAALGRRRGWDFVVMYGQTEATARMAYLPPDLAMTRPDSIGRPIPGGGLEIDPVPHGDGDAGELVYRGPNVMLGYAGGPEDLGRGRTVHELRTGDLGRRGPDGLFEIVGRRADFVKIAGLRIDPSQVEALVQRAGLPACVVGTDDELVIVTEAAAPFDLAGMVREAFALPSHAVRAVVRSPLPRLASGKPDRAALRADIGERDAPSAPQPATVEVGAGGTGPTTATSAILAIYAESLGVDEMTVDDTFAGLGGDSLSYIEVTLGLERVLGRLPDAWETRSIAALGALATRPPDPAPAPSPGSPGSWLSRSMRTRSVEMSVALRALAIFLVVGTHIGNFVAPGGAHVLMAIAGFNFARFRLTPATRDERARSGMRAIVRIVVPTMIWVTLVMLVTDHYELRHLLLVNSLVTDELWGNLWFIELLVYVLLAMTALLAIPAVDRFERRWPFGMAAAVLGVGLLFRFGVADFGIPSTMPVLWLFALGWAASRATHRWQRGLVMAVVLVAVPGYFDAAERNLVILAGLTLLVLVPRVRLPSILVGPVGLLAGASLYIYLVHWEVYPLLVEAWAFVALGLTLAAGIAAWLVATRIPNAASWLRPWLTDLGGRWPASAAGNLGRRPPEQA